MTDKGELTWWLSLHKSRILRRAVNQEPLREGQKCLLRCTLMLYGGDRGCVNQVRPGKSGKSYQPGCGQQTQSGVLRRTSHFHIAPSIPFFLKAIRTLSDGSFVCTRRQPVSQKPAD